MKKLLIILLILVCLWSCSKKESCKGCTVINTTYVDDEQISRTESPTDCSAKPGTTVKRSPTGNGKVVTSITTVICQ